MKHLTGVHAERGQDTGKINSTQTLYIPEDQGLAEYCAPPPPLSLHRLQWTRWCSRLKFLKKQTWIDGKRKHLDLQIRATGKRHAEAIRRICSGQVTPRQIKSMQSAVNGEDDGGPSVVIEEDLQREVKAIVGRRRLGGSRDACASDCDGGAPGGGGRAGVGRWLCAEVGTSASAPVACCGLLLCGAVKNFGCWIRQHTHVVCQTWCAVSLVRVRLAQHATNSCENPAMMILCQRIRHAW